MKVRVKSEDINRGERRSGLHCPLALAIRRARVLRGKLGQVVVGINHATVHPWVRDGIIYDLPAEARQFRSDFDKGLTVKPFEFELEEA